MISYSINSIEGLLTGSIPVNNIGCETTTPTNGSFSVRGTLNPNNSNILLVKENKTTKTSGVQSGTSVVVTGSGKITNDDYQLLMKTLSQGSSLSKTQFESKSDFIIWKIPFTSGFLTYGHFYRSNAHKYYIFASQKNYSLTELVSCLDSDGVGYTDVTRINAGSPVQTTGIGDSIGCCFFSESYTPFARSIIRFGGVYTYSISHEEPILSWNDSCIGLPFNEFLDTLNIGEPEIEEKDDEYGNYSTSGGYGGGSFDDSSDAFGLPSLPSLGVSEAGFVNVYKATAGQLVGFADELFPDFEMPTPSTKQGIDGVVENLNNVASVLGFFADSYLNKGLIDYVIDCHIVPVSPAITTNTGIKVGYKTFNYNPSKVTSDYVEFDCGSLQIAEYYQNFLDYEGTRAKLYAPFIGFVDIKPEWFQSGSLRLVYHFNIIDGSCIAFVIATSSKSQLKNTVVATFGGNCCVHMPITGLNYSSMISGILGGANKVVGGILSGSVPQIASGVEQGALARPTLEQSNGYNAGMSFMCYRRPYLLIERPVASFSKNYPKEQGLPLNVTKKLGNMKGFTTCTAPVVDNFHCLEEEKEMIKQALIEGTIF